jgi:hypothetical protein
MKYTVVSGIDLRELIKEVRSLLSEGWECQGGVCYAAATNMDNEIFLQAMIKTKEE